MSKLSKVQEEVLERLSKGYAHGDHYPRDAFNSRTIESLTKKGYVEEYYVQQFLHGAVRLTKEGRQKIQEIS